MIRHKTDQQYLREAAEQCAADSVVPSPSDLIIQLHEVERQKARLMHLLKVCRDSLERPLTEDELQAVQDYLMLQAARNDFDSSAMLAAVEAEFVVEDLSELRQRHHAKVLTFIGSYRGEKRRH